MNKQQQNEAYISRFILNPPNAMYDIGVGHKTEWQTLSEIYTRMKLFGCEPNPLQFELLISRFNGLLLRNAIASAPGKVTLNVAKNLGQSSLFDIAYAEKKIEVPAITLDQFDELANKPDRILLWIDIEGAELVAFQSAPELFASNRVRWINIEERREGEQPGGGWCKPKDLHDFLITNRFNRVAVYNRHKTHQDVIYIHQDEPRP